MSANNTKVTEVALSHMDPPLNEQLKHTQLSALQLQWLTNNQRAIDNLYITGLLIKSEARTARKRLVNTIEKLLKEAKEVI